MINEVNKIMIQNKIGICIEHFSNIFDFDRKNQTKNSAKILNCMNEITTTKI